MRLLARAVSTAAMFAAPTLCLAQQPRIQATSTAGSDCVHGRQPVQAARADHQPDQAERPYDVILEVPRLCVDKIQLKVVNLQAHVALNVQISNLVKVTAGADAVINRVDLGVYGVDAKALLLVDLDDIVVLVDHTMTFIDNNPQIITALGSTLNNTVGMVGGVGNTLLQPGGVVGQTVGVVGQNLNNLTAPGGVLSQTVNTLGQTVQRTLDTVTGNILEKTLDQAGKVLAQKTVGRLLDLPVVRETTNAAGQVVRQVRDTSGAVIDYTLDKAGKIVSSQIVSGSGQPR